MKKTKILFLIIVATILIFKMQTISNAQIQIVKDATTLTNITLSNAYDICRQLAEPSSTLGSNDLEPHLCLNSDWGIVEYLAISEYGASITGTSYPTIQNTNYTSTTKNMSGVIDFGKTWTVMSSMWQNYGTNTGKSIKDNKNTKFVEVLPENDNITNTLGMAFKEISDVWNPSYKWYPNSSYPYAYRQGFSYFCGAPYGYYPNGNASNSVTFRPVIWN